MMVWFRLWWYAMRHEGLWRQPTVAAVTLAQSTKCAFACWMYGR